MNTSKAFIFLLFLFKVCFSFADEGMWLPNLIKAYNYSDMQSKGLMISAEDLYSANKSSLNDAIAHFNGGCTAEVVSNKGLILTNHHCGYSQIAAHSTPERDYLKDGFWAMSFNEELKCNNLYVDFIRQIEDVTGSILTSTNISQKEIEQNIIKRKAELTSNSNYQLIIKPFNYGKKYFAFFIERFTDIRLVGAPPSAVGKFGFDTDNWVWPRHTGDFSVFRIYANKNNRAASYNTSNVPYKPLKSIPVSLEGVKEGDFTMVYGFPGTTEQHLTSYAVDQKINHTNPARILMREKALEVINATMLESTEKKIHLSSHQSSVSNYWKKFKGENFGLKKENAIGKKIQFEKQLQAKIDANPTLTTKYGSLLEKIKAHYDSGKDIEIAFSYYVELFYSCLGYARPKYINPISQSLAKENKVEFNNSLKMMENIFIKAASYNEYYKSLLKNSIKPLLNNVDLKYIPPCLGNSKDEFLNDISNKVNLLMSESYLTSKEKIDKLSKAKLKKAKKLLKKDGFYQLLLDLNTIWSTKIIPEIRIHRSKTNQLMKQYVTAIEEAYPNKQDWYDANGTLRISYGELAGSTPKDGMEYKAFTTTDGILQKYIPGDREYDVPEKLISLIKAKDFGKYAEDGVMKVCFTGTNHTTGGNSGSPVLNKKGHLIGINFDRSWESTMSDVMFSDNLCRNITVDIRYVLFIIDKYAGCKRLVNEMTIIEKEDPLKIKRALLSREIEILSNIIETSPKQADLYFKRGKAYYELGKLDKSLEDYEKSVELNPTNKAYIKQRDKIQKIITQIKSIRE